MIYFPLSLANDTVFTPNKMLVFIINYNNRLVKMRAVVGSSKRHVSIVVGEFAGFIRGFCVCGLPLPSPICQTLRTLLQRAVMLTTSGKTETTVRRLIPRLTRFTILAVRMQTGKSQPRIKVNFGRYAPPIRQRETGGVSCQKPHLFHLKPVSLCGVDVACLSGCVTHQCERSASQIRRYVLC